MIKKLSILLSLLSLPMQNYAEEQAVVAQHESSEEIVATVQEAFAPFTGKVAKGKVRLRATPAIDGFIVQELQRGEMLLVDGEQEGFYQVECPEKVKGYVFRTFVLDGKVEGSRVNVRLAPDLEAPVIAQLNSGDTVDGYIYANNTKWIECNPPQNVRFFVATDYIEKAGDAKYLALCKEKKIESTQLLQTALQTASLEFDKPFNEIDMQSILTCCETIVQDFTECPDVVAKAQDLVAKVNADYLARKIVFLEGKAKNADLLASKLQEITPNLNDINPKSGISPFPLKLTSWQDVEQNYIAAFKIQSPSANEIDFYKAEKEKAITLNGVLTPYLRPVKNKPGDYLLLDPQDNHPLAYLYSTTINLQEQLGAHVEIVAAPRPNNQFAYPAYYVLAVEKK